MNQIFELKHNFTGKISSINYPEFKENSMIKFVEFLLKNKVYLSGIIFEYLDFSNIDFSNYDLSDCKFNYCHFKKVNFNNTDLNEVIFNNCVIEYSDFNNSYTLNININLTRINNCKFDNCNLSFSGFYHCVIEYCHFKNVNFNYTYISKSTLENIKFNNCNLSDATIKDSSLLSNFFTECNFYQAELIDNFTNNGFINCDLSNIYKISMLSKWNFQIIPNNSKNINDYSLQIACKIKTIGDWIKWFDSDQEFKTKRNTIEFKRLKAMFKAHLTYLEEMGEDLLRTDTDS